MFQLICTLLKPHMNLRLEFLKCIINGLPGKLGEEIMQSSDFSRTLLMLVMGSIISAQSNLPGGKPVVSELWKGRQISPVVYESFPYDIVSGSSSAITYLNTISGNDLKIRFKNVFRLSKMFIGSDSQSNFKTAYVELNSHLLVIWKFDDRTPQKSIVEPMSIDLKLITDVHVAVSKEVQLVGSTECCEAQQSLFPGDCNVEINLKLYDLNELDKFVSKIKHIVTYSTCPYTCYSTEELVLTKFADSSSIIEVSESEPSSQFEPCALDASRSATAGVLITPSTTFYPHSETRGSSDNSKSSLSMENQAESTRLSISRTPNPDDLKPKREVNKNIFQNLPVKRGDDSSWSSNALSFKKIKTIGDNDKQEEHIGHVCSNETVTDVTSYIQTSPIVAAESRALRRHTVNNANEEDSHDSQYLVMLPKDVARREHSSTPNEKDQEVCENLDRVLNVKDTNDVESQVFQSMSLIAKNLTRKAELVNYAICKKADAINMEMAERIQQVNEENQKKLDSFHEYVKRLSAKAAESEQEIQKWIYLNQ